MKKALFAAAAGLAALGAATAIAAEAGPPRGPGGPGGMALQSDSNNDGVITRAEFDASRAAQFTRMDANSDGQATREERRASMHRAGEERPQGGPQADRHSERGHRLENIDANQDGQVTREEFLARPTQHFDRMDVNNNGVIEASERPQAHQRGEGRDGNGARGWTNPDTDDNGALSRAEFDAQGAAMFARLDANSDGRLTQAEFEAGRGHGHGRHDGRH